MTSVAPVHAEVDVEVGHRYPLGVQKALEQQIELDRIEVGDLSTHKRPGSLRRSPAPVRPEFDGSSPTG